MKRTLFLTKLVLPLMIGMLLTGCVSQKKLVYFQGSDQLYAQAQNIAQQYEMRIKPADQILVKITCQSEPELLRVFAQDVTMGQLSTNTSNMSNGTLSNSYGYTITNQGYVILPAVGRVYINNMTCDEAADAIEKQVKELKLLVDPEVTVRLLNARVTVIGAVKTPKAINLTSERNTIIDVLAQCGDLDASSLRKNVKLFRETNGIRQMYVLDLTDVNVFTSPAFYVQQNDMIYVEPNKSLGVKSSAFYTFLGAGASILGLISSIVALAISIKKS
ncbi:MAG: polysaccharide biosynthesis/export family protein [Bacteroides sp.]|nr:polysaccharide biosynthesis/export family protein [Bacteroides sp.]MCM1447128.1 polysaccharide biosynthesis/export family protein [Bacteroides sp.]MCM1515140.1 polysaccharide biosynthesis/export family protein [Paraprevotella sp.]